MTYLFYSDNENHKKCIMFELARTLISAIKYVLQSCKKELALLNQFI